jgi:hypothetical protein
MRFYMFVALTTLTFFLALVLLGLGLHYPQARLFRTTRALAAPAASALTTLTIAPPYRCAITNHDANRYQHSATNGHGDPYQHACAQRVSGEVGRIYTG